MNKSSEISFLVRVKQFFCGEPKFRLWAFIIKIAFTVFVSCIIYLSAGWHVHPSDYIPRYDRVLNLASGSIEENIKFININEKVYKALNRPASTPPNVIASLINLAAKDDPKVIMLDIDLTYAVKNSTKLIDYLSDYNHAPLLLIKPEIEENESETYLSEIKLLEEVVLQNSQINWGNTTFNFDQDYVVRKMPFFKVLCDMGKPVPVPSLVLSAFLIEKIGYSAYTKFINSLKVSDDSGVCDAVKSNDILISMVNPFVDEKIEVNLKKSWLYLPYNLSKYLKKSGNTIDDVYGFKSIVSYVKSVYEKGVIPKTNTEDFRGKIVLIGGTYKEARDIKNSPVGRISGAQLILEALNTSLQVDNIFELIDVKSNFYLFLIFALLFSLLVNILRASVAFIFSIIILITLIFYFNGQYTAELFSILISVLFIELVVSFKNLMNRICLDIKNASRLERSPSRIKNLIKIIIYVLLSTQYKEYFYKINKK
jgi:CHASE2 domain-containing sensor protein